MTRAISGLALVVTEAMLWWLVLFVVPWSESRFVFLPIVLLIVTAPIAFVERIASGHTPNRQTLSGLLTGAFGSAGGPVSGVEKLVVGLCVSGFAVTGSAGLAIYFVERSDRLMAALLLGASTYLVGLLLAILTLRK